MPLALLQQSLQRPITSSALTSTPQRSSSAKQLHGSQAISEVSTADSSSPGRTSWALPSRVVSVEAPAGVPASSPKLDGRSIPMHSVEVVPGMPFAVKKTLSAVRQEETCEAKVREPLLMSSPVLDHRAVTPTPFRRCVEALDGRNTSPMIRCRGSPLLGPRDGTTGLPSTSPLRSQVAAPWSSQSPMIGAEASLHNQDHVAGDARHRIWDGKVPCTRIMYSDINSISRKGPGSPLPQQRQNGISEYDFLKFTPTLPVARPMRESGSAAITAAVIRCKEGTSPSRAQQERNLARSQDSATTPIAAGHNAPAIGAEAMRMEPAASKLPQYGQSYQVPQEQKDDIRQVRRAPGQFSPERSTSPTLPSRSTTPMAERRHCIASEFCQSPLTQLAKPRQDAQVQQHPIFEKPSPATDWQPMERVGGRSLSIPMQERAAAGPPRAATRDLVESLRDSDVIGTQLVLKHRPRVDDIVNFYREKQTASCIVPCEKTPLVSGLNSDERQMQELSGSYPSHSSQSSSLVAPWEKRPPCDRPSRNVSRQASLEVPVRGENLTQEDRQLLIGEIIPDRLRHPKAPRDGTVDVNERQKMGATIAQLADGSQGRAWDAGQDAYSNQQAQNFYWKDWYIGSADIDCTLKRRPRSPCDESAALRNGSPVAPTSSSTSVSRQGRIGRSQSHCDRSASRCERSASPPKTWQDIGLFESGGANPETTGPRKGNSATAPSMCSRSITPTFRASATPPPRSKAACEDRSAGEIAFDSIGVLPGMAGEACDSNKSSFWRSFYHHTGKHGEHGGADMDHTYKKKIGEFSPLNPGRQCTGSDSRSVERTLSKSSSAAPKDGQWKPPAADVSPQAWRQVASNADLAFFDRSQSAPRARKSPLSKHRCRGGSVETTATITASQCSFDEASSCASTAITAPPRESQQAKDSHNVRRSIRAQRPVPAISRQPFDLFG